VRTIGVRVVVTAVGVGVVVRVGVAGRGAVVAAVVAVALFETRLEWVGFEVGIDENRM
jgi:hypothetical protein